ncbi:hypothetical protein GTA28_28995 [Rhodococcus hoagii]|nr:hypothetical protein [Prescottella equi]
MSDTSAPADPITRLQTGVNAAIDGAAEAARNGVAGAADAARGAMNTSVGFVTTGVDGTVSADTLGLQGPQHIDAIRTETSAADIGTREAAHLHPHRRTPRPQRRPWHRRRLLRTQLDRRRCGTGRCRTTCSEHRPRARWRRARTDSADAARHRTSPPTG